MEHRGIRLPGSRTRINLPPPSQLGLPSQPRHPPYRPAHTFVLPPLRSPRARTVRHPSPPPLTFSPHRRQHQQTGQGDSDGQREVVVHQTRSPAQVSTPPAGTRTPVTLPSLAEFSNTTRLPSIRSLPQVIIEPSPRLVHEQREPEKARERIAWSEDTPPCVLVSSSQYYNMPFAIEIVMGKRWRENRGITVDDIQQSGPNMHVVLEGAPDLRVYSCTKCHKHAIPIVEIDPNIKPDFGPLPVASSVVMNDHPVPTDESESPTSCIPESPDSSVPVSPTAQESLQLELYRFDNCKTHCTSSRLHLGSRLILIFDFHSKGSAVSKPIDLLSKKPRTGTSKVPLSDLCDEGDQVSDDSSASSSCSSDESPSSPSQVNTTVLAEVEEMGTTTTEVRMLPQNCLAQEDEQSPTTTNPSKKARLGDILT